MTTALKDFPRTDLPEARHQQVRQMLVREARASSARTARLRWALPVAVGTVAAATLGAITISDPGELVGPSQVASNPDTTRDGDPTCETGKIGGPVDARSDGLRLLPADSGSLQLEGAWQSLESTGCYEDETAPMGAFNRVGSNGAVEASVSVAPGVTTPDAGPNEMDASLWYEPVTVRGVEGVALRGYEGAVVLYWTEGGEGFALEAVGIDEASVVEALPRLELSPDGMVWPDAPGGVVPAPDAGRAAHDLQPVEPGWVAHWQGPDVTPSERGPVGGDLWLSVSRQPQPRAILLRAGGWKRVVDVNGSPGYLEEHPDQHGHVLTWSPEPGVYATLSGSLVDDGPEEIVDFARSLQPVPADDPRIKVPEWVSNPESTETESPTP